MSAKHSSTPTKGHPVQQVIVFLVILAIAEVVLNLPGVQKFAGENLQLTKTDLIFIPIGSFLFFVFWKLMENSVFDPFLALHEAREAATEGSQELAQQKLAEAQRLEKEAAEQLNVARREAVQEKLGKVVEAKQEASKMTAEAENQALAQSEKTIKEAEQRIAKLRAELEGQAQGLAQEVVTKLKTSPQIANNK